VKKALTRSEQKIVRGWVEKTGLKKKEKEIKTSDSKNFLSAMP
jgi:hypothetical protein